MKNILKLGDLKLTGKEKNLLKVILWQWTNNVPELAAEERVEKELVRQ